MLGWLLACTGAGHSGGCVRRSQEQRDAVWVACDRARNQILWLDRDLIVRTIWKMPCPVSMVWNAGRLWVACALEGKRSGAHRLLCLGRDGRLLGSWETGPIRALARAGEGGGVFLLGGSGGGACLWRCDARGQWHGPLRVPGAEQLRKSAQGLYLFGAKHRAAWLPEKGRGEMLRISLPGDLQVQAGVHIQGNRLWCRSRSRSSPWRSWSPDSGQWTEPRYRPWLPESLIPLWPERPDESKPPVLKAWLRAQAVTRGAGGSWLLRAPEFLWLLDRSGQPRVGQGGFGFLAGATFVGGPPELDGN